MKAATRVLFLVVILMAAASGVGFADWTYVNNGYYYNLPGAQPPGTITSQTYDSQGRMVSFVGIAPDGSRNTFNLAYNGNNFVILGTDIRGVIVVIDNSQRNAAQVTDVDTTRAAATAQSGIVTSRVEAILAPKSGSEGKRAAAKDAVKTAAATGTGYDQLIKAADAFNQQFSGLSAGDAGTKIGLWANGNVSWLGNTASSTNFNGNLYTVLAGADVRFMDRFVVGLAAGWEGTLLNTSFNDGRSAASGFILSPYIGVSIIDNLTLDVVGSYTWLSNWYERNRSMGSITANNNSARGMISANLNYYYLVDNWKFRLNAGYMYTNEYAQSFTESNLNLVGNRNTYVGEVRLGGRVAYLIGNVFEPYLAASYINDVTLSTDGPRAGMEGVLGFNFYPFESFVCSLEATNLFFMSNTQNTRLSLNLRYEF